MSSVYLYKYSILTFSDVTCRSKEKIDDLTATSYIGINYVDTLLDLEDYDFPIKRIFNSAYTRSSKEIFKDYQIFVRQGVVKTDRGWISPNIEEKRFYTIAQEKEMILSMNEVREASDPSFASFTLRINNLQQTFFRKYDKIQDVLSNLGK